MAFSMNQSLVECVCGIRIGRLALWFFFSSFMAYHHRLSDRVLAAVENAQTYEPITCRKMGKIEHRS